MLFLVWFDILQGAKFVALRLMMTKLDKIIYIDCELNLQDPLIIL